jgi:hypothetical protein
MRNAIIGTVVGLVLGMAGALAYSQLAADGQLAALQSQLDAANAKLTKTNQDRQQLASETSSVSDQIDELQASNADLKKQLEVAKAAPAPVAPPPEVNPMTLSEMMRSMMRGGGGFQGPQQRLFLLQSRLHLTPDQANAIKAAMQADAQTRREIGRQMFQGRRGQGGQGGQGGPGGQAGPGGGGQVDPALLAKANTLDPTLATVLQPLQKAAYQQLQTEEQAARADTQATTQMNQMAPLLQLNDSQKDQLVQQLYQVQMQVPDPGSLMTNPNASSIITTQAQATDAALAKVLNPQQMVLYQQAGQVMAQNGPGGRGGGNGSTAAPAAGGGTAAASAVAANGGTAAAGAPAASSSGTNSTLGTTGSDNTNAAAASTNAAPATTSADGTTNAATSTTATNGDSSTTNATTNAPAATPSQ